MTSSKKAINKFCPNSGKPIEPDSLTTYLGHVVGFCNPHCRDDFAKNPSKPSQAKMYFDVLIKENVGS